jgi:peptidoglycan/xylan/chitin deacetylase (PgdA/CDA1 family)
MIIEATFPPFHASTCKATALATAPIDVCITVDMEPDCPPYLQGWRGVRDGGPRLLDLFATEGIAATYFTTGDTAVAYPEAVTDLVAAGHELACHGMTHRAFPELLGQEAQWEIATSLDVLRRFAPVTSFRAPYLRFPTQYLHLLQKSGIKLDSSQAKYKRSTFDPDGPVGLKRIPASVTSSVIRLPAWLRNPWLLSVKNPVVLFVHPWEFVDLRREKLRLDCRFRTGDQALGDLQGVIRLFKSRGARFWRMDDLGARASSIH